MCHYKTVRSRQWASHSVPNVLFVNAGVVTFSPIAETSESVYDEQFDINMKGAYFTIQKALPFLNDGASIILNTSVADIKGTVGASAYSATNRSLVLQRMIPILG